ncbi:MAG: hypothetical protein ACRCU5_00625 [Rhizobiaceae bacterium]
MTVERTTFGKRRWLIAMSIALLIGAGFGLAFAGWVENGPQILLSLGASAMAWCF